jgi:hypothetical protein
MASEAGFCMIEKSLFNKCLQNRRRHWANILVLGCMIADQQKYEKISSGSIQQCLLSHTRFYPRHRTSLSHSLRLRSGKDLTLQMIMASVTPSRVLRRARVVAFQSLDRDFNRHRDSFQAPLPESVRAPVPGPRGSSARAPCGRGWCGCGSGCAGWGSRGCSGAG